MGMNPETHATELERLSALVDGELEGDAVARVCSHWRDNPGSRSSWHAYHVIGDVLRSEDLACDPARDSAFMLGFRARLAKEPVVLAPQPVGFAVSTGIPAGCQIDSPATGYPWGWRGPAAVAAGVAAVAGVLVLTLAPGLRPDPQTGASLAPFASGAPADAQPRLATAPLLAEPMAMSIEPQTLVASNKLIRDARLDRYLDAHKAFAGSSALGVPSVFLRSATTVIAPDH